MAGVTLNVGEGQIDGRTCVGDDPSEHRTVNCDHNNLDSLDSLRHCQHLQQVFRCFQPVALLPTLAVANSLVFNLIRKYVKPRHVPVF